MVIKYSWHIVKIPPPLYVVLIWCLIFLLTFGYLLKLYGKIKNIKDDQVIFSVSMSPICQQYFLNPLVSQFVFNQVEASKKVSSQLFSFVFIIIKLSRSGGGRKISKLPKQRILLILKVKHDSCNLRALLREDGSKSHSLNRLNSTLF